MLINKSIQLLTLLMFAVSVQATSVEQKWQLAGFQNPESVVYDDARDVLYVSNVSGDATNKDGNGTISSVSLDGKLLNAAWVSGLDAPKGLAISGNKLYVADIDTLVEIDIETATVSNRYVVADAKFLNDVAADDKGNIYVSDMVMNRIHRLQGNQFDIWIESEELENPNGLHFAEDDIMLGSWGKMTDGFATETPGHLKRISLKDKHISSVGDGSPVGNLDGVEGTEDTGFFVTDWMNGGLFLISRKGKVSKLLDLDSGSADLEFIENKNMILIPMMKDNVLNAYQLK
ncbi:MAG: SMP-30/gluconolactonase/LRE family protein [Gammaproteobacteria bacterium]